MIPLPETFRADRYDFKMMLREGRFAIFRKTKGEAIQSYETVVVRECKEHTWPNGQTTPAHEVMPGNELWGLYGWTYATLEQAQNRMALWSRRPHDPCL